MIQLKQNASRLRAPAAMAVMALAAFACVGTASATVLCSTATNPCTSKWPTGTEVAFSLKSGTSAKLTTTAGETLNTSTSSGFTGKLTNGGSSTSTPTVWLADWWFINTTHPWTEVHSVGLEFHSIFSGSAPVTSDTTIHWELHDIFGFACDYGVSSGTSLGTVTGGSPSTFTVNAVLKRLSGGFLCPETTKLSAEYVQTKPSGTSLYAEPS
jgi:hypothetical protein